MLEEILNDDVVEVDVDLNTWRECVEYCGNLLVKEGSIKKEFINSMIETVEELGPYMILIPKVAFFHGKPGINVKKPCLSLITLKESVYFTDFENQEIKCAFGFGAVDSESHMQMLVKVAGLLQDTEFVELITNNGSKDAIMKKIAMF